MKRVMAVALLVLGGCGENVESQLAGCKAEHRDLLKVFMDVASKQERPMSAPALESLPAALEAELAKWQGQEGLAKCKDEAVKGKDVVAKAKEELAKVKARGTQKP